VRTLVPPLYDILRLFGSPQIRHAATLAGNIANASPIADTLPFLYVMEAEIELTGRSGSRCVDIRSFYKGYKSLDMADDELITRIIIPLPADDEILRLYKVSKRRDLDISTFTAAFLMKRRDEGIESIKIAYGGVGQVVLRLPRTEEWLSGRPFAPEVLAQAGEMARQEISPISDVRGSRDFRLLLAETILQKFYHESEEVFA
jgi:xanthine dehydrogenase small subunit